MIQKPISVTSGLSTKDADFAALERVSTGLSRPWDMQEVADKLSTEKDSEVVVWIKDKLGTTTLGFDPEIEVQVSDKNGISVRKKFIEFLNDLGPKVKNATLIELVIPQLQRVLIALNSRTELEENKWPKLITYLLELEETDEIDKLTIELYKGELTYRGVQDLTYKKREFACSFLGLKMINFGHVNSAMLQELPDDFFEFLRMLREPEKIARCKLSLRALYSLYEKFGNAAVDLFDNTVEDKEDLDAWLSLTVAEFYKKPTEENDAHAFKGWTGKRIVGLYREDPVKFRALARPVICRVQRLTDLATEFFSDLYDQDKPLFFALTQNTMSLLLTQTSWDVLRELYRKKLGVFIHVTSLQAMPLVLAIGFENCVKLYETNCKAMLDVINLPLWLQIQNKDELYGLICLRSACDEPFLSPKLKCEPSVSAQFWGKVSKLWHATPHILPPEAPRGKSQAASVSSSSSSSREL